MNTYFAQMLASQGCYSTSGRKIALQSANQAYVHSETAQAQRSILALKSRLEHDRRINKDLMAAAEIHVIKHPRCPEVFTLRALPRHVAARRLLERMLSMVTVVGVEGVQNAR